MAKDNISIFNAELVFNSDTAIKHKYSEEYIIALLAHGDQGFSPATFAGAQLIPPHLIDEWRIDYPEFDNAYKICALKEVLYWENQLRYATKINNGLLFSCAKIRLGQIHHLTNFSSDKIPFYNNKGKTKNIAGDKDLALELKEQMNKLRR